MYIRYTRDICILLMWAKKKEINEKKEDENEKIKQREYTDGYFYYYYNMFPSSLSMDKIDVDARNKLKNMLPSHGRLLQPSTFDEKFLCVHINSYTFVVFFSFPFF